MWSTSLGHEDALKYISGCKPKVKSERPIISARGVNATPPQDQYFKGHFIFEYVAERGERRCEVVRG